MQEEHLVDRADRLQREAHAVLDDLGLLMFLAPVGHAKIVGSLALGLMTWPDIDIDVEVVGDPRVRGSGPHQGNTEAHVHDRRCGVGPAHRLV